jgi:hypothetical protein
MPFGQNRPRYVQAKPLGVGSEAVEVNVAHDHFSGHSKVGGRKETESLRASHIIPRKMAIPMLYTKTSTATSLIGFKSNECASPTATFIHLAKNPSSPRGCTNLTRLVGDRRVGVVSTSSSLCGSALIADGGERFPLSLRRLGLGGGVAYAAEAKILVSLTSGCIWGL